MKPSFQERTSDPFAGLRKGIAVFVSIWIVIALISGHRAIWQVQKLELRAAEGPLKPGSRIAVETRSSARATVDVTLELAQGARTETLAVQRIPGNRPTFNPRWRRGALSYTVTPAIIETFRPGPATVRAIATGRSQWFRIPPPEVRERTVTISSP